MQNVISRIFVLTLCVLLGAAFARAQSDGPQAQARPKIGLALGASRQQVVALVLRTGLTLLAVGLVLGLVAAAAAARLIQALLYYVHPLDPLIYVTVTVLFSGIATVACLLPSLRASRIDPIIALRAE